MRRLVVLLLVLASCGGGGSEEPTAPTPKFPASATDATLTKVEPIDGHEAWVDEGERVLYVEDCAVARSATERPPYGATDEGPGYGYICSD